MKATLKDVAAEAGVTVTTVSRVLNNRGPISEKTRRKVYDAINKLDYRPNEAARSLGKKRTNVIGVIVPSIANPFFSELVNHLEAYAFSKGYHIELCNSYHEEYKEKEYLSLLQENRVAGIIISSRTEDIGKYLTDRLPVVSFERIINETTAAVTCDNYEGGKLATEHLLHCGCKHLAAFQIKSGVPMSADKRIDAFRDTCKANGIEFKVFQATESQFQSMRFQDFSMEILKKQKGIDGFFIPGDVAAIQFITACQKCGIRVPDEIQVVGFDDISMATWVHPQLTTIHQPIEQMSKIAVNTIIDFDPNSFIPLRSVIPVSLIERKKKKKTT